MNRVTRRLRSLLIAFAVLALSATIVLAGRPAAPVAHPEVAPPSHDGGDQAEQTDATDPDESEAAESPDAPDPSEADVEDVPDATATEHADNHGTLVSEAAQAETPDGFANHGAYVRTIARDNHGHAVAATKHAPTPAAPNH